MTPKTAAFLAVATALAACQAETVQAVSQPTSRDDQARAATAASAMPVEQRKFRDWIAVCDNGNACTAFGPAENESGFVRVAIQPGPDAKPGVTIGLWPSGDGGALGLTVDGQAFAVSPHDAEAAAGDPPVGVVQRQAAEIVRAMARGQSMVLTYDVEGHTVSLSGAAAALLWIDERQGRLDTPTALIRRGEARPAGAVPPAPPLPRVPVAAAVSQAGLPELAVLPASLSRDPVVLECAADVDHLEAEFTRPTVARLGEGVELWGVACFAGAYNFGTAYWITGEGGRDPRPAPFHSSGGEVDNVLVNAGYDPETRRMTAFNKGRGLGDCGVAQAWVWSGRAFVLTNETAMTECWGVAPELWPTYWRTAQ